METKFNFNSQICTTREQSERLLALGLKKETADIRGVEGIEHIPTYGWSLDRLRELIPENIFTGVRNQWHRVMYNGILTYEEGEDSLVIFRDVNIYDRCVSCIEWLIKEGYFNKEYLV